jgi:DNA-binding response OmpR family regulator
MARIFLVEDSEDLREATAAYLVREGHEVVEYHSADALPENPTENKPDLYILDVMLPGKTGIAAAHLIRANDDAPLIFVSARDDERTKAAAFKAGADDYVTKPFSPRELAMRVGAVLRRYGSRQPDRGEEPTTIRCRDEKHIMTIHLDSRRIEISGREISLTKTEWGILSAICRGHGAVVMRDQILHQVFGYDSSANSRTLDTHIKNLRRKLGPSEWFETVHAQGYRLALTMHD